MHELLKTHQVTDAEFGPVRQVIRYGTADCRKGIVVCTISVVVVLAFLLFQETMSVGSWVCILLLVLFVRGIWINTRRLDDRSPVLSIARDGFIDHRSGRRILWHRIRSFRLGEFKDARTGKKHTLPLLFLGLVTADGVTEIAVDLSGLDESPESIARTVQHHAKYVATSGRPFKPAPADPALRKKVESRFAAMGKDFGFRTRMHHELQDIAEKLTAEETVHCDIVLSDAINALVAREGSIYLVGITNGAIGRLSEGILLVLWRLSMKRMDERKPLIWAPELEDVLHRYALVFLVGHELGHIRRGHFDDGPNPASAENGLNLPLSYIKELEADTIGALAIVGDLRSGFDRLLKQMDLATAIGLMQASIASVLATFAESTSCPEELEAYPHPVVRLLYVSDLLVRNIPLVVQTGTVPTESIRNVAETMMTEILQTNFPDVYSGVLHDKRQFEALIRAAKVATAPIIETWERDELPGIIQERLNPVEPAWDYGRIQIKT